MQVRLFALALLLSAFVAGHAGKPVAVSAASGSPERAIVLELTVPATPAAVWQAFTTTEGLSTWLGPSTTVDLRPGGDWLGEFPRSPRWGHLRVFCPEKGPGFSGACACPFPRGSRAPPPSRISFRAAG